MQFSLTDKSTTVETMVVMSPQGVKFQPETAVCTRYTYCTAHSASFVQHGMFGIKRVTRHNKQARASLERSELGKRE